MGERLKDKVAIVMGAGTRPAETGTDIAPPHGNGKAAAVLFAREGAVVACIDRDGDAAEATRLEIESEGGSALFIAADVTDEGQVQAAVDQVLTQHGRIDILHNNVGIPSIAGEAAAAKEDADRWDQVMAVNVKGMFLACKAVLPTMTAQQAGSIINISSIAVIRGTGVASTVYSASKAAVIGLTQQVALQGAAGGVRCNAILPGLMDTAADLSRPRPHRRGRRRRCPAHARRPRRRGSHGSTGHRLGYGLRVSVLGLGRKPLRHRGQPSRRRRHYDKVRRTALRKPDHRP